MLVDEIGEDLRPCTLYQFNESFTPTSRRKLSVFKTFSITKKMFIYRLTITEARLSWYSKVVTPLSKVV